MDNYLHRQQVHIPTQREPDGNATHKNVGGGYGYQMECWGYARRFLTLGSEKGTYYTGERELTKANTDNLLACIKEDGVKFVDMVCEMRDRVPKRDTIFYALALAFSEGDKHRPEHDNVVKDKIHEIFSSVVRTGSDLLMFVAFIQNMRGWGKSLRRLIASWYMNLLGAEGRIDRLTYQMLKYQNRNGIGHRDVLRRCHLGVDNNKKFVGNANQSIFRWIVKSGTEAREVHRRESDKIVNYGKTGFYPEPVMGYETLKKATDLKSVLNLIEAHGFTHEMIPSKWKNEVDLWDKLLERMPITAMIRNLSKMTSIGLVEPFSQASKHIVSKLDKEIIRKARIHPVQMLMATLTYDSGQGMRGNLKWSPVQTIVDALEEGFYHSFENVEPINKNVLIAVDVSGSMSGGTVAGCPNFTPAIAAAVMAMVFARREPNYHIVIFDSKIREVAITKYDKLQRVCDIIFNEWGGSTDCSLPMTYATNKDLDVEAFILLTDNVSWYGSVHPTRAFETFKQHSLSSANSYIKESPSHEAKLNASKARLATISMTATDEMINDPDNPDMLDCVGFDTSTPQLVNDFLRGSV